MRILVMTTDCFGGHGGIAQYNRDLVQALALHPHCSEVRVVVRNQPLPLGPLPPKVVQDVEGATGKAAFVASCLKAAQHGRYDLLVCGHINLLPVSFLVEAVQRAPVALLVYGIEVWTPPASMVGRALVQRIHHCISISAISLQRFKAWAGLQHCQDVVLPNAIHLEQYACGPKPARLVEKFGLAGKRVLLTLARLDAAERYKGVDEILEELPALLRQEPNLAYVVAGDGTDRARLEEKARSLGLGQHVIFTGRVQEADKADTYRLADAFAMPGRGEGFGFVFLEALACGIPVVASKLDGSREAVRDGALGILVDPDNREELRSGLLKALHQPCGVMPEGLRYFEMANFTRRTHAALDAILSSRGHA